MITWKWLSAFVFSALVLPAETAHAINPFSRSGFDLTGSDVQILMETTRPFLEDDTVSIGTAKTWTNPQSGNNGMATLIARFEHQGMPCRRIQHDIKIKTKADPFRFIIDRCRVADGTWKML